MLLHNIFSFDLRMTLCNRGVRPHRQLPRPDRGVAVRPVPRQQPDLLRQIRGADRIQPIRASHHGEKCLQAAGAQEGVSDGAGWVIFEFGANLLGITHK